MMKDTKAIHPKKISERQVVEIARFIANQGNSPTVAAVREYLHYRGSNSTIHKYLLKWKIECYQKSSKMELVELNSSNIENNSIIEANRILDQNLKKQIINNEYYAQELIIAEKTNITLTEKIHQLQTTTQELQLQLTKAEAINGTFDAIIQKMQNKLDINSNEKIKYLKQTINDLQTELKTLNETSITGLRETSNRGHEALMQERVISINLQAKIDSLNKELLENKKQLHESVITAQVQNRSLLRQNKQLQKIIQEHGLDKLPQLKEELSLKFSKEAAAYGK